MAHDRVTSDIDAFREAALHCPLPAAVELIGEKWTFLIARGALNGLQHFEEFQAAWASLANPLRTALKIGPRGTLQRSPTSRPSARVIYR